MKNRYIIFILALCFLSVASCRVKEGEPGPAGASALNKSGSISGMLKYLDYKGDSVKLPFSYEYYESLLDNEYWIDNSDGTTYSINIRRRDLNDSEKRFSIQLYGNIDTDNSLISNPNGAYIDFSCLADRGNNNLFAFDDMSHGSGNYDAVYVYNGSNTTFDITNFKLDTIANTVTFDYTTTYNADDIDYDDQYSNTDPAVVKGSVNIPLKRRSYSTYVSPPVSKTSQE